MDSKRPFESVETAGISEQDWDNAHAPTIAEYGAQKFLFQTDADGNVRIAFSSNERDFECAVTLSPYLAIDFARQLLVVYATVKHNGDV